jgi:hypothetical protein
MNEKNEVTSYTQGSLNLDTFKIFECIIKFSHIPVSQTHRINYLESQKKKLCLNPTLTQADLFIYIKNRVNEKERKSGTNFRRSLDENMIKSWNTFSKAGSYETKNISGENRLVPRRCKPISISNSLCEAARFLGLKNLEILIIDILDFCEEKPLVIPSLQDKQQFINKLRINYSNSITNKSESDRQNLHLKKTNDNSADENHHLIERMAGFIGFWAYFLPNKALERELFGGFSIALVGNQLAISGESFTIHDGSLVTRSAWVSVTENGPNLEGQLKFLYECTNTSKHLDSPSNWDSYMSLNIIDSMLVGDIHDVKRSESSKGPIQAIRTPYKNYRDAALDALNRRNEFTISL